MRNEATIGPRAVRHHQESEATGLRKNNGALTRRGCPTPAVGKEENETTGVHANTQAWGLMQSAR